jgi:hypothetical protein
MRIEITTEGAEQLRELLEKAGEMPARSVAALTRALTQASLEITGQAVKLRFTGKGPFPPAQNKLGVRSGRLRRSIRVTKPQANLRTGEISLSYGSNVAYFKIHEFGFTGPVQVKGHTRRGRNTKAGKAAKNAPAPATHQVRAHQRQVKVPARAPLGTQLKAATSTASYQRNIARELRDMLNSAV